MRDGDFQIRSTEISRIEGLSDAVFGFAITLLIVSLEVPKSAMEVLHALRGFASFAVTFGILFMIWRNQFKFFRRYGLEDDATVWLTAVLLFTVLLFVYPLKFFFGTLVEHLLFKAGFGDPAVNSSFNQAGMGQLLTMYGLGWCAVFGVFHLMYRHAYRKRDDLKLNAIELFDTTEAITTSLIARVVRPRGRGHRVFGNLITGPGRLHRIREHGDDRRVHGWCHTTPQNAGCAAAGGGRVRRLALAALAGLAACSSPKQEPAGQKAVADSGGLRPMLGGAPGSSDCPATGLWAKCSVLYRLDRSGIAPHLDSTAKVEEKALTGRSFVVKIGQNARLEVFLYPDSAARMADGAKLDRRQFVNATAPQTINRERTLIENGNLIGLLTSLNERLRERASDALTAGAPQPSKAK